MRIMRKMQNVQNKIANHNAHNAHSAMLKTKSQIIKQCAQHNARSTMRIAQCA